MAYRGTNRNDEMGVPSSEDQAKIPLPRTIKILRGQSEQKIDAGHESKENYNRLLEEVEHLRTKQTRMKTELRNAHAFSAGLKSVCAKKDASCQLLQEKLDRITDELKNARAIQVRMESLCADKDASCHLLQGKLDQITEEVKTLRARPVRMEKRIKRGDACTQMISMKKNDAAVQAGVVKCDGAVNTNYP